jgi:hypothetical protein
MVMKNPIPAGLSVGERRLGQLSQDISIESVLAWVALTEMN